MLANLNHRSPEPALAKLVRGNLKVWFAQRRPDLIIPATAWTTPWVVRISPRREGEDTVLRYLARYVFRIAITNSRILRLDERSVTFRNKHCQSLRWRTATLDGEEFMRPFLQHVMPKGLHNVRYFGLWHQANAALPAKRVCFSKCNRPRTSRPSP
jgi:Putative transposase